jgi:hypothetical protein
MPDNDHVQADEIKQSLRTYFKAHAVRDSYSPGSIAIMRMPMVLTGF